MQQRTENKHGQQGFTLVELAIVLVIIGLIIGGVLVGQDMIRSAEIRSTIGQYEKYNTALNTFRDKFGGIPGDLANGARFGFEASSVATARNNDGKLIDCGTGALLGCETALFWSDLADADLIGENIAVGGLANANHAANGAVTTALPTADIGNGNLWQVYNVGGRNYYQLSAVDITTAGPGLPAAGARGVTPIAAFNIDQKVDDSNPLSGIAVAITARGTAATSAASATTAVACVDTVSSVVVYNTDENNAGESEAPNCAMMLRMN